MSANNGVIRIGRKGLKKFAFGEDGEPFEVDVVAAFQEWINIDESFRLEEGEGIKSEDVGTIPTEDMSKFHAAAVAYVKSLSNYDTLTTSEALDFLARLREQYNELTVFFRPKSREERVSPDTSEVELRFSEEPTQN